MKLYLTHGSSTVDVTTLLLTLTWSGDKASISRQLVGEIMHIENSSLPEPELGDVVTLIEGSNTCFVGVILTRELNSEENYMSFIAFDYGYYLHRNDGTYKFSGATPEAITRTVCTDRGIPIAELPFTGAALRRKFAGVKLDQLITTAWSLASQQNENSYAIRYTPEGLLVKLRDPSSSNVVLKAGSNLMNATTREDASKVVNSVAIYDVNGTLLRRTGDSAAQQLYGVMEEHITQADGDTVTASAAAAKQLLTNGQCQRNVTVNILGDASLLTGETVIVRESKTGLQGVFWIDADVHTWKNNAYYSRLTLNCRNVMATASSGSEIT